MTMNTSLKRYIYYVCGGGGGERGEGGASTRETVKRWKGRWRWPHKIIIILKDI